MFVVWLVCIIGFYIYRLTKFYRKRWSIWNIFNWVWVICVYSAVAIRINLDLFAYYNEAALCVYLSNFIMWLSFFMYAIVHYHSTGDNTVPWWRHSYRNLWGYSIQRIIYEPQMYQKDLFNTWLSYQYKKRLLPINYIINIAIIFYIAYITTAYDEYYIMWWITYLTYTFPYLILLIIIHINIVRSLFTNNYVYNYMYIPKISFRYPGKIDTIFHFWSQVPWHDWLVIYRLDNEYPLFSPEASHKFKTPLRRMQFQRLDRVNDYWRYKIPVTWVNFTFDVPDRLVNSYFYTFAKSLQKIIIYVVHHVHYFYREAEAPQDEDIEYFMPELVYSNFYTICFIIIF